MNTYFLTGAAGFVGAALLERLVSEQREIHVLLKKDTKTWRIDHLLTLKLVHVHLGNLEDKTFLSSLLTKIQPAIIYHLATSGAYSTQNNPEVIFNTNILGTLNLLEATQNIPYHLFVNTSSSSEYGSKNAPMKETDLLEPDSEYAISKVAATALCQLHAKRFKKPIVTFRLFSVFGPKEEPTRLFPTLLSSLKSGSSMKMVNPQTARDFIYVDDVVDLYRAEKDLEQFSGEIFNVGTGIQTQLKDLVQLAQKVTAKSIEFKWQEMPDKSWDKPIWVADMGKTQQLLKWKSKFSLEKGLLKMWRTMSN